MAEMPPDELLPTVLAAGGTAAQFCAQSHIWPMFEEWLHDGQAPDGTVSREFMSVAAAVTLLLVQGIEREILAEECASFLAEPALDLRHRAERDIIRCDERKGPVSRPLPALNMIQEDAA